MKKIMTGILITGMMFNVIHAAEWAMPNKPAKKSFWRTKSKAKLYWGMTLIAAGGASAVYGLSRETITTETRVARTETPVQLDLGTVKLSKSFSMHFTRDNSGTLTAADVNSSITNTSGYRVKSVKISGVNCEGATVVNDVVPGSSSNFALTLTQFNGAPFGYGVSEVLGFTGESTFETIKTTESKMRNPAVGFLGVGTGLVGASFIVSYLINKAPFAEKVQNMEINPVIKMAEGGLYQGMTVAYHF